ncbi:MAG TPA: nucleotidyltransferase family protein [Flavobacterium sp.]|nr:nucleotidyltransferase family protein [Flavobacterium sp.]
MKNHREHLILKGSSIREALIQLDLLAKDAIIFVVDKEDKLLGSITDGDIRRGLINGAAIDDKIETVIHPNPKFLCRGEYDVKKMISLRDGNFRIIPILDKEAKVVNVINFREIRSYLPIDAVIMAGGKGERLKPLTDKIPKPLLKIGSKPILEHNIDRLILYGIDDFWISVNYLGEQIKEHFNPGYKKNIVINFVQEEVPMGTIGAVSNITNFEHDYVLIINSDVLTNIDYEHFYLDFIKQDADFAVVSIPYEVSVPYAVLETSNGHILSLKEKPTYTYYSNGGIYLMKRFVLQMLPKNVFFNATDFMEKLIQANYKVISYPLLGYWLDIGKHEDFEKAQRDINQIKF